MGALANQLSECTKETLVAEHVALLGAHRTLKERCETLAAAFKESQRQDWMTNDKAADKAWLRVCRLMSEMEVALATGVGRR